MTAPERTDPRTGRRSGRVVGVNGNLVTVAFDTPVMQNEMAHVRHAGAGGDERRFAAEVIRVRGTVADMQLFEDPRGLKRGDSVEFSGELLSVELGPGLLGRVFDGLQNPLHDLAERYGVFLPRGAALPALDRSRRWEFTPSAAPGDTLHAGDALGSVPEHLFRHRIMVPFGLPGRLTVREIRPAGPLTVEDRVAVVTDERGAEHDVFAHFRHPAKAPARAYAERLLPRNPLVTTIRAIDTFCPVAKGGTFCVPGPFGAGKTVIQQLISRNADVDVVVVAACGERAGEVVETIRTFPELTDPRSGASLMDRTVIICNTSSMPVAAREASVHTATAIAEYYRQMGLDVLLLADSTSRWAQAMREISGRLEEIPGEEAYPAYLESAVAAFYERAGLVRLRDGRTGSLTIGGTVSPAGGNFEEPVTQATLKVVGAFEGLSRERSDARRYPAIDILLSWSKYPSVADPADLALARDVLRQGHEAWQMMQVLGEEGTAMADFVTYLKSEFLDVAYLQQDAFHPVDGATPADRQRAMLGRIAAVLRARHPFSSRDAARAFFQQLTQALLDLNREEPGSGAHAEAEAYFRDMLRQADDEGAPRA